jgi:Tol biopolymer transport system component
LLIVSAGLAAIILWHREPAGLGAVQFSLSPPDGWTIGHNGAQRGTAAPAPHVAVSPDGQRLAYVMFAADNRPQVWLKRLDAASGQPMPGTDDASFPFWSPDGRFIAYFAGGKLKKVDASGGPSQTICDAPAGEGGSWGPDGTILFAPDVRGPLFRVSAAGGLPTPVAKLDTSETSQRWPQFLPDGRSFLYLSVAGAETAVYAGSLDSGARTLVLKGAERSVYASGHLLFVREGTLMAQPYDVKAHRLSAEALPVAEDVAVNTANHRSGFSASDSGVLVYRPGGLINSTLQISRVDRGGKRLETFGMPGAYRSMRLSPNDASLAVRIDESLGKGDWWLMDIKRGGLTTRVTSEGSAAGDAFWSPDGARLVFGGLSTGVQDWYQKSINGGAFQEVLLKTPYNKGSGDWSSDGQFVIYAEARPQTGADLWVLPLSKNAMPRAFVQTNFPDTRPRFSPDGRWVAYMSTESGRAEVYVVAFPSGDRKRRVSVNGGDSPVWRRDGKELFYVEVRKVMAVDVRSAAEFEAGVPHALFDTQMPLNGAGYFNPTADGQQFVIAENLSSATAPPVNFVVNWPALLKK